MHHDKNGKMRRQKRSTEMLATAPFCFGCGMYKNLVVQSTSLSTLYKRRHNSLCVLAHKHWHSGSVTAPP